MHAFWQDTSEIALSRQLKDIISFSFQLALRVGVTWTCYNKIVHL